MMMHFLNQTHEWNDTCVPTWFHFTPIDGALIHQSTLSAFLFFAIFWPFFGHFYGHASSLTWNLNFSKKIEQLMHERVYVWSNSTLVPLPISYGIEVVKTFFCKIFLSCKLDGKMWDWSPQIKSDQWMRKWGMSMERTNSLHQCYNGVDMREEEEETLDDSFSSHFVKTAVCWKLKESERRMTHSQFLLCSWLL